MDSSCLDSKDLIQRLAEGWTSAHSGLVQEFVHRLCDKLDAEGEVQQIVKDVLIFTMKMRNVRLRGFDQVTCILLARKDFPDSTEITRLVRSVAIPGRMIFFFVLSQVFHEQMKKLSAGVHSVIFSPEDIHNLLESNDTHASLKHRVRGQISKRTLIPYSLLHPVQGPMFYGREKELNRLFDEEDVSFAIAGPSRIGKTSILKEYARRLICQYDPRAARLFEISLYDCRGAGDDLIAMHIAMQIDPSKRSAEIKTADLLQFLCRERSRCDGPLEILIDEVDEACNGKAFEVLGDGARKGICRVLMTGRGVLLNLLLTQRSPFSCRLDLIRPEPLDESSAKRLILEPLADLGFNVEKPLHIVDRVFRLTGRLPHLLQFYGKKLAELAIDEKIDTISMVHVDRLQWEFETAQYFTSPLQDLANSENKRLALALLRDGRQEFSLSDIQETAHRMGVWLDPFQTIHACNDLVVNNILAWNSGLYRIANEALPHYAKELGLLNDSMERQPQSMRQSA